MKPVIFYIDDEPHNLAVFESSLPEDWEIKTYSDPLRALEELEINTPWVIVCDQRMPAITGVRYLELAKARHPLAVRIVVTAYSEEDLVVQSVRKAQVFDYIKKPWESDELEAILRRAIEFYKTSSEKEKLTKDIVERENSLKSQNEQLKTLSQELQGSLQKTKELKDELECWVPPFLLETLQSVKTSPNQERQVAGLTYDIVSSHRIKDIEINGIDLPSLLIQRFSESVLRHGGWRESHTGDSAYAHFGIWEVGLDPFEGAMAAAREFSLLVDNLCKLHNVEFSCGIALHMIRNAKLHLHAVRLQTFKGEVLQKSFDTSSIDVSMLHKMEKLVHTLKGTNIILSNEFLSKLKNKPTEVVAIGEYRFNGQDSPTQLFLIPSSKNSATDFDALQKRLKGIITLKAA